MMNTKLWEEISKNDSCSFETIKHLINMKADVNSKKAKYIYYSILEYSIYKNNNLDMIELLIDMKADITGKTLVHDICYYEKPIILDLLLRKKADVNQKIYNKSDINFDGLLPIHSTLYNKNTKCLETLIKYNADINTVSSSGRSLLENICYLNNKPKIHNKIKNIKLLIKHKANIDNNREIYTPLYYACRNNYYDCAKLLIDNCANINIKIKDNVDEHISLLDMTSRYEYHRCVKVLIEKKINVDVYRRYYYDNGYSESMNAYYCRKLIDDRQQKLLKGIYTFIVSTYIRSNECVFTTFFSINMGFRRFILPRIMNYVR